MRKSQILMTGKYFYWCQIWLARMIDKSGNISIIISINTKSISILEKENRLIKNCQKWSEFWVLYLVIQIKQVRIFSSFRFRIRNKFPNIFTNKRSLGNIGKWANSPTHSKGFEDLKSHGNPVLKDPIMAAGNVATAKVVTFENHRRLFVIETVFETALQIVPGFDAQIGTVAGVFCGAVVSTFAMLQSYSDRYWYLNFLGLYLD